jgi:hypothetical protein
MNTRRQSRAYLQSPIAFMISWLPKHESTIPPAALACHLSFSMSRNISIVSSPLLANQGRFWRIHRRHTCLRNYENTLIQRTESPTNNVPCLNQEVDSFGVPIVVVIDDTHHLHDLQGVWKIAMKVTYGDNTSLVPSAPQRRRLPRDVRMRCAKESKACIQARKCNCQEQKASSSLCLRHGQSPKYLAPATASGVEKPRWPMQRRLRVSFNWFFVPERL